MASAEVYVSGTQVLTLKVNKVNPTRFNDFLISFKNKKLNGEIHKTKKDCFDALLGKCDYAHESPYREQDIIGDNFIRVKLEQEDTADLIPGIPLKVQIKFYGWDFKEVMITDIEDDLMVKEAINTDVYDWEKHESIPAVCEG